MNTKKHVLLLTGSAKRPHSTSESLGSHLLDQLGKYNFNIESMLIHRSLKSDEGIAELLSATNRADLLIVSFPLYVDNLPFLVIQTLELIAKHRQDKTEGKNQRLMVIANCGFPEAQHNNTALAICRQFAKEAGFIWAGGLSLGGGEAIDGKLLSEVQGMARNVIKSLNLSAKALTEGNPIPKEAIELMAKPIIPIWAYTLMGGLGWKQKAKRNKTEKKLRDRPYLISQKKS